MRGIRSLFILALLVGASSTVEANGATASEISGLTDTQIRGNWRVGSDDERPRGDKSPRGR